MARVIHRRADRIEVGIVIWHQVFVQATNEWVKQNRRVIRVDIDPERDIVTIYDWPVNEFIPRDDKDLYKHQHAKAERINILSYG